MVFRCPVCQTEYIKGQINFCCTCGWDLRPYSLEIPESLLEKERMRIAWAREWWKRSQAQVWKLESNLEKANREVESLRIETAKLQQERSQLMNRLSEFYAHSVEREKEPTNATVSPSEGKLARIVTADYSHLQSLLAQKQWQKADRETAAILLQLCDRTQEGWLKIDDLKTLPYLDLHGIDQLWKRYSNGQFGFSVQQSLWREIGGTGDAPYEIWCQFCDRVGWRDRGAWVAYERLNFSLDAPAGHLPAAYWEMGLGAERLYYWWWLTPIILFNHFNNIDSSTS